MSNGFACYMFRKEDAFPEATGIGASLCASILAGAAVPPHYTKVESS